MNDSLLPTMQHLIHYFSLLIIDRLLIATALLPRNANLAR